MSVPKSERKTSTMEYIATARKLAAKVFRYSNGLPKRYAFRLGNPLFEHAQEVVFHVNAANQTYVNDRAGFEQRRMHLNEAQAHLQHVESYLDILREVTQQLHDEELHRLDAKLAEVGLSVRDVDNADVRDALKKLPKAPNENVYAEFAELIASERSLIGGVKKNDTAKYKEVVQPKEEAARAAEFERMYNAMREKQAGGGAS